MLQRSRKSSTLEWTKNLKKGPSQIVGTYKINANIRYPKEKKYCELSSTSTAYSVANVPYIQVVFDNMRKM